MTTPANAPYKLIQRYWPVRRPATRDELTALTIKQNAMRPGAMRRKRQIEKSKETK